MTTADRTASEDIAELERRGRRLEIGASGARVVWRTFGAGPAVVLLHGGHGSWLHWVRNIDALSRRFQLLVPDMPGFGESETPPDGWGVAEMAARLGEDLRELAGQTPLGVAGFSFGGLVAAALAANARVHVRRLALVGAAGSGSPRRQDEALVRWRDLRDPMAIEESMRHNLRVHMLSREASIDALALAVHARSCRATRFRSRHISRAGGLQAALDRFGKPTLLLWGRDDVTVTPALLLPQLLASEPLRTGRLIGDAGHWAQFERPGEVNLALADFFGVRP